jgi:tetratricopeptide (TPR) repeat protein
MSKLDERRLRRVAQAADCFYLHLENGMRTMKQLFSEGLGKMQVADINARLSRRPIERYEWPLAAAILLFAIALLINDRQRARTAARTRAKQPIATAVAALLFTTAGWIRAASPGLELYEQQKFPEAYANFEKTLQENPGARQTDRIQFDAGAAAYKMKDYNKALQSLSQALLSQNPHPSPRPATICAAALARRRGGDERHEKTEQLGERAQALRRNAEGGVPEQERQGQLRLRQKEDRGAEEKAGTATAAKTATAAATAIAKTAAAATIAIAAKPGKLRRICRETDSPHPTERGREKGEG